IYKALRQEKMTTNEMATAYFLYQAQDLFKRDKIRKPSLYQHAYDDKGPYTLKRIDYMKPSNLDYFNYQIKDLPKNEQCYFSIDCSRKYELVFLCEGIKDFACLKRDDFQEFLMK